MILTLLNTLTAQHNHSVKLPNLSSELKILSWNIFMLPYISNFNNNGERAAIIGDQLVDSDYQIIVFQEAFSQKCRNILQKKLKEQFPYQYGPVNAPIIPLQTNSGLWIVSKIPLKELKSIRFTKASSFDRIAHKGAVLFQGKYKGNDFQLLTTHLQADNPDKIAMAQCKEIAHLLHEFYKPDIPQLLCGDFNMEMNDTVNYNKMLQTLDAENGSLSGEIHATYDEQNNSLAYRPGGKSKIIDYVLTRNTHLIEKIQRSVKEFYYSGPHFNTHLSDHYALEATVQFSTRQLTNIDSEFTSDGLQVAIAQ